MKSFTVTALLLAFVLALSFNAQIVQAQDSGTTEPVRYFKKKPTKREILRMNVEVLRDLSLEEITELADIAGVSSLEELIKLIVTTASKSAESLFDAPLPISAVTGEDIQRAGATSIMEALRLVPGMIVRETVPGNFDIHVRGFDGG
jgi:iron complex outermembrane receptor protein